MLLCLCIANDHNNAHTSVLTNQLSDWQRRPPHPLVGMGEYYSGQVHDEIRCVEFRRDLLRDVYTVSRATIGDNDR